MSCSRYACIWADGVYFNARVGGEGNCVLVVVGAEFYGERELLPDLKDRGMSEDPKLAIADGALGFTKASPTGIPNHRYAAMLGPQDGDHRR